MTDQLNKALGRPLAAYTAHDYDDFTQNIGHIMLDKLNGRYTLETMCEHGINHEFSARRLTANEMHIKLDTMFDMIHVIETQKETH